MREMLHPYVDAKCLPSIRTSRVISQRKPSQILSYNRGVSKSTSKEKRARKRHKKSCEGKVAYPDKKSAKLKAELMREKKNQASIQHYECQQCGQWHLGNRSW